MPEDKSGETSQRYAISREQISALFVLTFVGMVATLVLFLILLSARPQGQLEARDTTLYDATIAAAAERLSAAEERADGTVTIPIARAIELIAERGVQAQSKLDAAQNDDAVEVAATTSTDETQVTAELSAQQRQELAAALPDGAAVYNNCITCHQATGQGIPGAFPPLVNHTASLYNQAGGPDYLANVILYGLQGEIEAAGTSYNGLMTPWASLADEEIAAVLNYVLTEWGNDQLVEDFMPFVAADIAEHRGKSLSGMDVHSLRQELGQADDSADISEEGAVEATETTTDAPVAEVVDNIAATGSPDDGPEATSEEVTSEDTTDTPEVTTEETSTAAVSTDNNDESADEAGVAELPVVSDEILAIAAALPDGAAVYNNCIACHQATGQGIPGAFPPLVAHTAKLYNAEGGQAYLPQLILQGIQGEIQAEGMTYNGVMTPWASLSDEQIAAVLNYIVNEWDNDQLLDNFVPYIPADIADARVNLQDVYSLRQELTLE